VRNSSRTSWIATGRQSTWRRQGRNRDWEHSYFNVSRIRQNPLENRHSQGCRRACASPGRLPSAIWAQFFPVSGPEPEVSKVLTSSAALTHPMCWTPPQPPPSRCEPCAPSPISHRPLRNPVVPPKTNRKVTVNSIARFTAGVVSLTGFKKPQHATSYEKPTRSNLGASSFACSYHPLD